MKKYKLLGLCLSVLLPFSAGAAMQNYDIDSSHSFVVFKISHLGISTTVGQFDGIEGKIAFDGQDPTQCTMQAQLKTAAVDTNHAERDKHLRGKDFLDVNQYPVAQFVSKSCEGNEKTGILKGDLTFMGQTKPIEVKVTKVGEGPDPWGGYRAGFEGTFELKRQDFGINYNLGPNTDTVQIQVFLEGVKKL